MQGAPTPPDRVGAEQAADVAHGVGEAFEQDGVSDSLGIGAQRGVGGFQVGDHRVQRPAPHDGPGGGGGGAGDEGGAEAAHRPDLVERRRGAAHGLAAIPVLQQGQAGRAVSVTGGERLEERSEAAGFGAGGIHLQRHRIGEGDVIVGDEHLLDPVDAGRIAPLEAQLPGGRRIVLGQVHLVGRREPP